MTTRSTIVTVLKLTAAVLIAAILIMLMVNAIRRPVHGTTHGFTADFTDVSGLQANSDVRIRGLQVGKVDKVEIVREGDTTLARVDISLVEPYVFTTETRLAVKYQNLTGTRYVDMSSPNSKGTEADHLSVDQTQPSFDITKLFNGLQPVLRTLSPEELNDFTQNALTVLEGDGGGLGPMLDSIQKLANLAQDRHAVISVLVDNMARIDASMGGKAQNVIQFLRSIEVTVDAANRILDEFRKTDLYGPQFMRPVHRLIAEMGFNRNLDVDQLIQATFSSFTDAAEALRLLPVTFQGLQIPGLIGNQAGDTACTHGQAQLPETVKVLLNASEVTICNAG